MKFWLKCVILLGIGIGIWIGCQACHIRFYLPSGG